MRIHFGAGSAPRQGAILLPHALGSLGTNAQNGVAFTKINPFVSSGAMAATYVATNPPSEFPVKYARSPTTSLKKYSTCSRHASTEY